MEHSNSNIKKISYISGKENTKKKLLSYFLEIKLFLNLGNRNGNPEKFFIFQETELSDIQERYIQNPGITELFDILRKIYSEH